MFMRERARRGEKRHLRLDGMEITVLDVLQNDYVKCLLPNGKIHAFPKAEIDLRVIDTKDFEKLE